jgi:hypothetical protein
MTTQPSVTQAQQTADQGAPTTDAEKVRRVLSVREPVKNQDKSAAQAAASAKPAAR